MGIISSIINGGEPEDDHDVDPTFTLTGTDGKPMTVSKSQLAGLDWNTLEQLRQLNQTQGAQDFLAPYEHRAYAREAGADNPVLGAVMPVLAAGYQAKKLGEAALGVPRGPTDTGPSFEQFKQGLIGAGEGVVAGLKRLRGQGT